MPEKTFHSTVHSAGSGARPFSPPAPSSSEPTSQLQAADLALLEGYLGSLLAPLRLLDWHLSVRFDPALEDACAMVDAPTFQRRAVITIGAPFLADTPEDRRDTLVHELLHLVLMGAWQYTDQLLEQELSARAARVAWLGFTGHIEQAVDQLASVIAPNLPLPPALPADML